ncbi:hypothetical protein [Paraburkholderia acidipaludis]|uniref:hypothetical protein n=1 Tax=Paraburkholderia acidipaludis TaxID=660537 RepID=UPI0004808245|nr:hypothetical protein [Paraburkholderia acidipaludis]
MLQQTFRGAVSTMLLPTAGSALLAACVGGSSTTPATPVVAAPMPPTPILASVNNFRDVAGADDDLAYQPQHGMQ